MCSSDLVKLGQLYLQNGLSGSEQIISSEWVERATNVQTGTGWNYGYLWWLQDNEGTSYSAQGFGGQVMGIFTRVNGRMVTAMEKGCQNLLMVWSMRVTT